MDPAINLKTIFSVFLIYTVELTVRHFHNLKRQNKFYIKSEQSYADRFRDGFSQCAKEVTKFLYSQQNRAGEHIIVHLNECMRRLDSLTNANNMQIANNNNNNNNNNYIPNDTMQLDMNHQQSFIVPPQSNVHHQQNNIRQPIAIPLLRKSPIPYLPLPLLQPQKHNLETRLADNGSPLMRSLSRDSMSSPHSTSSSPIAHQHNDSIKDEGPVWRPW
jgi:Hairy Orange